jgi:hypothetical protein
MVATPSSRAPRDPSTSDKPRVDPSRNGHTPYAFETDNEPNADILLRSLRAAGYSLEAVVGDLADNPIDADASIILIELGVDSANGEWWLNVADDGSGMDEDTLDQMMRLGSRTAHDLRRDLGAFGLGSDTAVLAVGRNKHVITRESDGEWLSSMWDLDVIEREQRFVKHLGRARPEEIDMFAEPFQRAGLMVPSTGTLVRVTKADRVGRKDVLSAQRAVLKYVNQTYRRFIQPNGGLTIMVNGDKAVPTDPLWRHDPATQILLDEQIEWSWRDEQGKERTETIGVVVAHLPDLGGPEAAREAGITITNSGFYIQRNGREIAAGKTLGMFQRHNDHLRFRAELNFPAALDAQLGVTFLKSSAEVRINSQALRDKIDQVVGPYRRQSAKLYRRSNKVATESIPHEHAAKLIEARAAFLRRPNAEIEARQPSIGGGRERRPTEATGTAREPRKTTQNALANAAEFEARQLGPTAPFYEGWLKGKKITVVYNSDHPAYERLILENRDNLGTVAAIDFLVYSLVAAELRNVDENNVKFMEAMREDASFNLRQLLTV